MIQKFLSIHVNKNGQPIDREQTESFKLFQNLKIASHPIMKTHLGSFPVVYANFGNVKGDTFDSVFKKMCDALSNSFEQHSYLLKSCKLSEKKKQKLKAYIDVEVSREDAELSFAYLTQVLFSHFEKRVYVFIDEYDAPPNYAILEGIVDLPIIIKFV